MNITQRELDRTKRRGYILLLTVLISSIILAISFGVYSLGLKQFLLSAFLSDSQKALSAADRGIECFMYWDALFRDAYFPGDIPETYDTSAPGSVPTVFRSLDTEVLPANAGQAYCSGQQLTNNMITGWSSVAAGGGVRTSYTLRFGDKSCVDVVVDRTIARTEVTADGYSDCDPNNHRRAQRRISAIAQ